MTDREYREIPGIRRSELWLLNPRKGGSPEKFLWAKNNPATATPAMVFGSLAHLALLEPHEFTRDYTFAPEDIDRRTKAGKALYAEFLETVGDREVVTQEDWDTACKMAQKVLEVPFGRKLLDGDHEKLFQWTDKLTGVDCKIRVDAIRWVGSDPVIVDYKTCPDASTDAFKRKAVDMGYEFQAGMYCEGVEAITGKKPRFVFIAQEKNDPFCVNVLEADEAFIQRGKDIFHELLGIYIDCVVTGNFYGYMGPEATIGTLSLPAWAANE